jgi:serine/threonine-protein kinase
MCADGVDGVSRPIEPVEPIEPIEPIEREFSVHVASPRVAYGVLAVVSIATLALVLALGRQAAPTRAAGIALAIAALLFALLAWIHRERPGVVHRVVQGGALVASGLFTGAVGWFFGPNGGFAAYVVLACMLAGLLTGAAPVARPALAGWLTYLALAIGQAAAFALVLGGVLADESLTIVLIEPHPDWHHVMAHAALQGVYLAAFLWGRAFQRRYRELSRELIEVLRATARRATLVEEARLEYRRALAAVRQGGLNAAVHEPAVPSERAAPSIEPESTEVAPRSSRAERRRKDLADRLRRDGALDGQALARLVSELAATLEERHAKGGLHLEVQPRAVAADSFELLELSGAFELAPDEDAVRYLAPERLVGTVVDARADVYGLAATLYASLTGCEPYAEIPTAEIARAVAERMPVDPRALCDAHDDVELWMRMGLARRPSDRFASVSELRDTFLSAIEGRSSDAWRARARRLPPMSAGTRRRPAEMDEGPTSVSSTSVSGRWNARSSEPGLVSADRLSSVVAEEPWRAAYGAKMRAFYIGITLLCAFGSAVLAVIAREPRPRLYAWATMAAITAIAWLHWWIERQRPERPSYWLWALVGLLSVGPAYSFGLHSGFAAVVATWLFAGGVFRAGRGATQLDRRGWVLAGILLAHSAGFVLVMLGALPDDGNVVVRQLGAPASETIVLHLLLMGAYVAAYAGGVGVDRRFDAQTRLSEEAAQQLERQEEVLASARAQLDRLLADEARGIFSDARVGRFVLGRVLGRGGMGEVYDATDTESGERVALKVVRPDRIDPLHLRLFLSEAESLRRAQSSRVARVLEVAGIDQELPYIAMEYVEGRSLADILRERERLDLTTARQMLRHLARGLEDVHACGVIHRDIKPLNVIETSGSAALWKIVDFSVALPPDPTGPPRRTVVGTPAYMSPEQAQGESVDRRSDLYSLSVLLYRALTGRPPFTGISPDDYAESARLGGPPDPRAYAELPDDVALLFVVGLALRPEDRFASAMELCEAFESACDGRLTSTYRVRAAQLLAARPWRAAWPSTDD